MSGHDDVREMLALAAAGALEVEEMRRVEEHSRTCAVCRSELAALRGLAGAIREMPGPRAPDDLAARAVNRLRGRLAEAAEKRWDNAVLAVLTLFAWTVGLASWAIARIVTSGLLIALDTSFATWLIWLAASTVLVWMTAGAAAIMLGRGRRLARRNS